VTLFFCQKIAGILSLFGRLLTDFGRFDENKPQNQDGFELLWGDKNWFV